MRRRPLLACGLTLLLAPAAAPAAAPGGTGGAAAPSAEELAAPIAQRFSVSPVTLRAGTPARFRFRIEGKSQRVRVRIELARKGALAPAVRLRLGYFLTGVRHTHRWTPAPGQLPGGNYVVTLHAFDDAGHGLRRSARASGRGHVTVAVDAPAPPPLPVTAGRFPVAGAFTFGGAESRFGAARDGHLHQGQDIAAAEGTPVVAPLAATVTFVDFQRRGAGHYVVIRGADGRDYVFMHLRAGSVTSARGARLTAGQPFAQVGSSGGSSGPHLHFELWPSGWYALKTSAPMDPLPQLQAWAAAR